MTLRLVLISALVFFAGCCISGYAGDGKVVSSGLSSPFLVELGRINLAGYETQTYRMKGFSSCNFIVGFKTSEEPRGAIVHVRMTDDRGGVVIDEKAALGEWVWTSDSGGGYFVYRKGRTAMFLEWRSYDLSLRLLTRRSLWKPS